MSNGQGGRRETLPEKIMRIILDERYGPLPAAKPPQPAGQSSEEEGARSGSPEPNSTRASRRT